MVTQYLKRTSKSVEVKKSTHYKSGTWISVENIQSDDLENLAELSNLTVSDLKDTTDRFEIPRVERHNDTILLYLRYVSRERSGLYTHTLCITITPDYFFTLTPDKDLHIEDIRERFSDIENDNFIELLFTLLKKIAQDYNKNIKQIRNVVLEQKIDVKKINEDDILVLIENEEVLNQYLASLVPMNMVLENVLVGDYLRLSEDEVEIYKDIINNFKQSADICAVNLKSIRGLRDSYQIIFTNRLNKIMKFLAIATITLALPTSIFSFFGMNIDLPLTTEPDAYKIILSISTFTLLLFIIYFYTKKWL